MAWHWRSRDRLNPLVISTIGSTTQLVTHAVLDHLGGPGAANSLPGQWLESAANSLTQYFLQQPGRSATPPAFYQIAAIHDLDYTAGYFAYSFDLPPDASPRIRDVFPAYLPTPGIAADWIQSTQYANTPILPPSATHPLDSIAWSIWLDQHTVQPVTPIHVVHSPWYVGSWDAAPQTPWLAWRVELTRFGPDFAVLPTSGRHPIYDPPQLFATADQARAAVEQYAPAHAIANVPLLAPSLAHTLTLGPDPRHPQTLAIHRRIHRHPDPIIPGAPVLLPNHPAPTGAIPDTGARWYWHPVHPDQPHGPTVAWQPIITTAGTHFAGRWDPSSGHPQWKLLLWPTRDLARQDFARHGIWAQRHPTLLSLDLSPWLRTPMHPPSHSSTTPKL